MTELPEAVLYEVMHQNAIAVYLPTNRELSPNELFDFAHRDDSLFAYRFCVYRDLRSKGWYGFGRTITHRVIRSARDVGADYYLYATSVEESHSLFIVSIYRGTARNEIHEKNRVFLNQLSEGLPLESLSGLRTQKMASIPFSQTQIENGDSPKQTHWHDIQRMTRVAGSLKKVWVQASVCVSDVHSLDSLERTEHSVRYLRVDHWIPSDPSKSLHSLILK